MLAVHRRLRAIRWRGYTNALEERNQHDRDDKDAVTSDIILRADVGIRAGPSTPKTANAV
jgi:hypothetical protein